jgi:DNA-binding response OmpR family regulator
MAAILVIDDDSIVLMFMKNCLADGHTIHCCETYSEAESCLSENNIDLVLLDLNLRGVQGTEIVSLLRSKFNGKIYLFSAIDTSELRKIARECEADGYIQKTLSVDYLRTKLSRILDRL